MHVGLNLIYLVPEEMGGMETYARELIPALLCERTDLRLTAFVNREAGEASGGPWHELIPAVTVPVDPRRRWEWVRGEQQVLPVLAKRAGVDLVHSLASTAPTWGAFRRVVTIHDVIYRIYPEAHSGWRSLGMRLLVPTGARRSDRVIAPSVATRNDLIRLLRVPAGKIDVVPHGPGPSPAPRWTASEELKRRFELGSRPFVLTVSAKRPHKNLVRLVEALALIPGERRPLLVLPGYATTHPHEQELRECGARLGLTPDIRFVGRVSQEELEGLYRSATCFVLPSLYEGFGLPLLEAMARGVPVACSSRGALGEIAGDAALIFDPERPESISEAIETLLRDTHERERLGAAGLGRSRRYSWAATARATLACYERALSRS
jgi:glycosyltransferase involved in cell wall biosynthesis